MTRNKWMIVGVTGSAVAICFVCIVGLVLVMVVFPSLKTNQDITQSEITPTLQPTVRSTTVSPGTSPVGAWKLIPFAITTKKTTPGWTDYEVTLALENQGSDFARPVPTADLGNSSVETQEGFTYQLQYINNLDYRNWPLIPPGFRVLDFPAFAFSDLKLNFRAAETSHPLRIRFAKYGTVDLQSAQKPTFPTERPRSDFQEIAGKVVEIPGKAKITFGKPKRFDSVTTEAIIDFQAQNLNKGYETVIKSDCMLFDGTGSIYLPDPSPTYAVGPNNAIQTNPGPNFTIGPGQTVQPRLVYSIDNYDSQTGKRDDRKGNAALTNAKLVCRGDFPGIFNLDF